MTTSMTPEVLGVETCVFIFSLSKRHSWKLDTQDIHQWLAEQNPHRRCKSQHFIPKLVIVIRFESASTKFYCVRASIASRALRRMGLSTKQWSQIQIKTLQNFWHITGCKPYPLPDVLKFLDGNQQEHQSHMLKKLS